MTCEVTFHVYFMWSEVYILVTSYKTLLHSHIITLYKSFIHRHVAYHLHIDLNVFLFSFQIGVTNTRTLGASSVIFQSFGAAMETCPAPSARGAQALPDAGLKIWTISTSCEVWAFHCPLFTEARQSCKHCSRKGHVMQSNFICSVCKVHFCLQQVHELFQGFPQASSI